MAVHFLLNSAIPRRRRNAGRKKEARGGNRRGGTTLVFKGGQTKKKAKRKEEKPEKFSRRHHFCGNALETSKGEIKNLKSRYVQKGGGETCFPFTGGAPSSEKGESGGGRGSRKEKGGHYTRIS